MSQDKLYNFLRNNSNKEFTIKEISNLFKIDYGITSLQLKKILRSYKEIKRTNNRNKPFQYYFKF